MKLDMQKIGIKIVLLTAVLLIVNRVAQAQANEPEMVTVEGGTTTLNGTEVFISTFQIGKYEVTQKQWYDVMGNWPNAAPSSYIGAGDNYPMYFVSWNDIVGTSSGGSLGYTEKGVTYYTDGFCYKLSVKANDGGTLGSMRYRLPTEAEWEYATKGGQSTHNYDYSGSDTIENVAWYRSNSGRTSHLVGTKSANELGIFDMIGNVGEWCSDRYGDTYPSGTNNPIGATIGCHRMARGGSWDNVTSNCTVFYRSSSMPTIRYYYMGFRLVLGSAEPEIPVIPPSGSNLIEMINVPGGTTTLNGTEVFISTFQIGKYEVTQKQWYDVICSWSGTAPSGMYDVGDNYPMYNVSWADIVGTSSGGSEGYTEKGVTYYTDGFCYKLSVLANGGTLGSMRYRLPTEAEWEYAAKGGQSTHNYTYSGSDTIANVAWYSSNSGRKTHEVGTKSANELGIFDMSGNVWEWCSDLYVWNTYPSGTNNPIGATTDIRRVVRGGGWSTYASDCTVSQRSSSTSTIRYNFLGFRLVLVP
ncbi:hypothetical protein FACS1894201_00980 [Bacteroidia bacterium]|nr:hypothetical protein FACS1894201_00980 [Bacteroidia bacterium]